MLEILVSGIQLFAVFVAVIVGIIIWIVSPDTQKYNRYLSLCLFSSALTFALFGFLYFVEDYALGYPRLFYVPLATELLIIPFCYLYINSLYQMTSEIHKPIWPHFLPFIVSILLLLPLMFGMETDRVNAISNWFNGLYIDELRRQEVYSAKVALVRTLIFTTQHIIYLWLIIRLIKQCRILIENVFSEFESIKLQWIRGIAFILGMYLLVYTTCFYFPVIFNIQAIDAYPYILLLVKIVLYLYILIYAMIHPKLFNELQVKELQNYNHTDEIKGKKYLNNPLTEQHANKIKSKLLKCLEEEKPYLDPDITINQLALKLGINGSQQLSQVINQAMQESFYQLINRYRVEEAKQIMQEESRFKIIDIAYQSGFKSSSTFYTHFKNITGTTPKKYYQSQKSTNHP